MSDYCTLFSQTFDGLLFSYLTITDVTWYIHHKFPDSFLLYIATKKNLTKPLLLTVLQMFLSQKTTLAHFACLCFSLEKTNNKKGKQTNNVNNNRLKEEEKKKKSPYAVSRYVVTRYPVTGFTNNPITPKLFLKFVLFALNFKVSIRPTGFF